MRVTMKDVADVMGVSVMTVPIPTAWRSPR